MNTDNDDANNQNDRIIHQIHSKLLSWQESIYRITNSLDDEYESNHTRKIFEDLEIACQIFQIEFGGVKISNAVKNKLSKHDCGFIYFGYELPPMEKFKEVDSAIMEIIATQKKESNHSNESLNSVNIIKQNSNNMSKLKSAIYREYRDTDNNIEFTTNECYNGKFITLAYKSFANRKINNNSNYSDSTENDQVFVAFMCNDGGECNSVPYFNASILSVVMRDLHNLIKQMYLMYRNFPIDFIQNYFYAPEIERSSREMANQDSPTPVSQGVANESCGPGKNQNGLDPRLLRNPFLTGKPIRTMSVSIDMRKSTFCMEQSRDKGEFANWLKDLTDKIHEVTLSHGGVFDKFTGDGAIIHFLVPEIQAPHQDHVLEHYPATDNAAFLCVSEMITAITIFVERLKKILLNDSGLIGPGVGMACDEATWARDTGGSLIVVGRGVVMACRLSDCARSGEIYIANSTYWQFQQTPLGSRVRARQVRFASKEFKKKLDVKAWKIHAGHLQATIAGFSSYTSAVLEAQACEAVEVRRLKKDMERRCRPHHCPGPAAQCTLLAPARNGAPPEGQSA